jgi:hypothetical protein
VTAALISAAVLAVGATAQAAPGFSTVTSPSPGTNYNEIDGVAAISASNAWAVGFQRSSGLLFSTLAEHWNGTAWSVAATASLPAANDTRLHSAAALSASNIWAVGVNSTITSNGATSQSLIEHFNGTSWSVVPSPAAEPVNSALLSVVAVSANDIWAVGHTSGGAGTDGALTEHWNGTAWSVVSSPVLSNAGSLLGLAAVSTSDVWAVGRDGRHPAIIIEHWNGTAWSEVSQPVGGFDASLNSVSAVSASDVWAVGETNLNETVTEHWDGASWTRVPSPSITVNNTQDTLSAVVALGSGDVWAVGSTLPTSQVQQTLAEHWNGTSWQIVPTTNPDAGSNILDAAGGTAAGQPLWAAGLGTSSSLTATLIETTTG